jgi:hypothetical protein
MHTSIHLVLCFAFRRFLLTVPPCIPLLTTLTLLLVLGSEDTPAHLFQKKETDTLPSLLTDSGALRSCTAICFAPCAF